MQHIDEQIEVASLRYIAAAIIGARSEADKWWAIYIDLKHQKENQNAITDEAVESEDGADVCP